MPVKERTMYFLWALLGLVLAVVLYTAWQIIRFLRHAPRNKVALVRQSSSPHRSSPRATRKQARNLKWVSMDEFSSVLDGADELIVIDLRPDSRRAPFPLPAAHVLCIGLGELAELLEWLPGDKSAAFYGASDLSVSMIQTSPCMCGSAPLYVLNIDCARAEVA
jgi:hypothetical protein